MANANKYQRKISHNAHSGRCHGIKNKCPKEVAKRAYGFSEHICGAVYAVAYMAYAICKVNT